MEVAKLFDGDWFAFTLLGEDGSEALVELKLRHLRAEESLVNMTAGAMTPEELNKVINTLSVAIVDWKGFERNGDPLPCTDENKAEILQHFWAGRLKIDEDETDVDGAPRRNAAKKLRQFSSRLFQIVQDPTNFTKN